MCKPNTGYLTNILTDFFYSEFTPLSYIINTGTLENINLNFAKLKFKMAAVTNLVIIIVHGIFFI